MRWCIPVDRAERCSTSAPCGPSRAERAVVQCTQSQAATADQSAWSVCRSDGFGCHGPSMLTVERSVFSAGAPSVQRKNKAQRSAMIVTRTLVLSSADRRKSSGSRSAERPSLNGPTPPHRKGERRLSSCAGGRSGNRICTALSALTRRAIDRSMAPVRGCHPPAPVSARAVGLSISRGTEGRGCDL